MGIFNINRKILDWCQGKVNQMYEKEGLTDKVIEYQVRINKIRNHKDSADKNNIITDDGFVQ